MKKQHIDLNEAKQQLRKMQGNIPEKILQELMNNQEEIINSPIRFNGVSIEAIKQIFAKYGYEYKPF